jgi:hypothetical protein
VAFFTDRLRPSSMSACSFDGTRTSDFDDTCSSTCHDGARDSLGESSPDDHTRQGWLSDTSGALILTATTTSTPSSLIPASVCAALANPNWRAAMEEEYMALLSNGTWKLVPRPCDSNVVTGK